MKVEQELHIVLVFLFMTLNVFFVYLVFVDIVYKHYSSEFYFPALCIDPTLMSVISCSDSGNPAGICLFNVNIRNTRTMCKICSKLTVKTAEQHH